MIDAVHLHQHARGLFDSATATMDLGSTSSSTVSSSLATSTVEPFSTALNGVNQSLNQKLRDASFCTMGIFAMVILVIRVVHLIHSHIRHMVAMNSGGNEQIFWSRNRNVWWPLVKKQLVYAPLFRKRHNREIRVGRSINVGTIPSRFHTMLVLSYIISNIVFCCLLDWGDANRYAIIASLRGRSGYLAAVNMVVLVLLAGRNNPLIQLLHVSFDTYNLLHRWLGRLVVIESCIHTLAWLFVKLAADQWHGVFLSLRTDPFCTFGLIGVAGMLFLVLLSPGPIRHAFYETFLNLHILFAITAIIGAWLHCELAGLPQLPYIQACVGLWAGDRLLRLYRIVRNNYSFSRRTWTRAKVEVLPGEAVRVTMSLPRYMTVKPGSHAYLRFGGVNPHETHPFSIAWVKHKRLILPDILPSHNGGLRNRSNTQQSFASEMSIDDGADYEKHQEYQSEYLTGIRRSDTASSSKSLPPQPLTGLTKLEDRKNVKTEVSFIIGAHHGLTRKLYNLACKYPRGSPVSMYASLEGPYAGHHSLDSYGHVVLIAGSSGITHQLSYISHLLTSASQSMVATRKILLLWVMRDQEHMEWIKPYMDEVLRMGNRRKMLRIMMFVTRPSQNVLMGSPSGSVMCYPGRPQIGTLLRKEVEGQVGAMAVTVCGPGGLADNVREAVRGVQEEGVVDFIEESFTW